jgi:hypothetical protein
VQRRAAARLGDLDELAELPGVGDNARVLGRVCRSRMHAGAAGEAWFVGARGLRDGGEVAGDGSASYSCSSWSSRARMQTPGRRGWIQRRLGGSVGDARMQGRPPGVDADVQKGSV